jgi:predicted adenylyl cyclase CyaB
MTIEVEIKYRIKDKSKLIAKLNLLGARFISKTHQQDIYYSPAKGKRFINSNPRLRIRKNMTKGTARLEYHINQGLYTGIEKEVTISDGDMMKLILKNLDFKEETIVDKIRNSYKYRQFNFDLDIVKGVGTFLEIELLDPADKRKAIAKIKELEKDLNLTAENYCKDRYLNMVLKKKGLL